MGSPSCRPAIIRGTAAEIDFTGLRHPTMAMRTDFISNDVSLASQSKPSVILLTGPNMAGKSTLLRMTATACIMAQLGMYVPAATASICPLDRIASRLGAYDNMFASASTFMVELSETNKILQEATAQSLVILDELGRGTSTTQAIAIAGAVLHELATYKGPCCIFSTHYASLADDYAYHPNIAPKHMEVSLDEVKREIFFKYRLVDGCALNSYGHHVAKLAGVPDVVTLRAESIGSEYEKSFQQHQIRIAKARRCRIPLPLQADISNIMSYLSQDSQKQLHLRPGLAISVFRKSFKDYLNSNIKDTNPAKLTDVDEQDGSAMIT